MLCQHDCQDRFFKGKTEDAARGTSCDRHDLKVSKDFAKSELLGQKFFVRFESLRCLVVDSFLYIESSGGSITSLIR